MLPPVTDQPEGEQPTRTHAPDRTKKRADPTTQRPSRTPGRPRPVLQDQRARLDPRAGAPRRGRHLLHDGLHHRAEPDHLVRRRRQERRTPRRRRHGFTAIAAGTALVAGVMTILMGVVANYPLALATGLGLNAFLAVSVAQQMSWADAMGLIVLEGLIILVLVLTGFRTRGLPRRTRAAEARDLRRHRPVHRVHRLRRRRIRTPGPRRRPHAPSRSQLGTGFYLAGLAGPGVLHRARAGDHAVGQQGPRRDPAGHPRDHDPGDHRREHRQLRARR